jgi:hypothetical protein
VHQRTSPDNIRQGGRIILQIQKGERWRCQNWECGGEILVTISSRTQGGSNPRCSCGEAMKKPYVRPALTTFASQNEGCDRFEASAN